MYTELKYITEVRQQIGENKLFKIEDYELKYLNVYFQKFSKMPSEYPSVWDNFKIRPKTFDFIILKLVAAIHKNIHYSKCK